METFLFPLLMLAMIGWMFYSQRKQMKNRQEALSQIQKGDAIVTIGGLHGVVDEINDQIVVLDVDGIYLTFDRSAIRGRVQATAPVTENVTAVETAVEAATTDSAIEE